MFRHRRSIINYLIIPALLVLIVAFATSCSEEPAGVDTQPGDTSGFTGEGKVDPGSSDRFLLGTAEDPGFAPGHIEVWATNLAYDDSAGVVSFDVEIGNYTERPIPAPIRFVITTIIPRDIAVVDFDGTTRDGFPYYDFSSKLGEDDILGIGEISGPVRMFFHTGERRAFAIGFRIDFGPAPYTGIIAGVVFRDDNMNGVRDRCEDQRCEPGIPGITVTMQKGFEENFERLFITETDADGKYRFTNLGEGVYTVRAHAPSDTWQFTSPNPLLVTLLVDPDGNVRVFDRANFGLHPPPCQDVRTLFGPILVGPHAPHGSLVDSTFVVPPSMLPVEFYYYLEALLPPIMAPFPVIVDSAAVWVNGVEVFAFSSSPPDSVFIGDLIEIPRDLIRGGENEIRLYANENEYAIVRYRVFQTSSKFPF